MARLVLEHQGHRTEFEVSSVATIGRQATNDIMVLTEKASRQHARVVSTGKHFLVEDLNSSNGTLVNDVKVQRHALKHGDVIRIGEAKITFLDEVVRAPEEQPVNLEGEVLGNYRIHNRIGQGAMGSVYKATQISMDRIVALKILKSQLTSDSDFVRAFLHEARTAGKLNHPNIVRVHDFGEAGGVYYFSMEYVNGETLEDVLKRDGKIPVERTLEVVRAVAEALEHAHGIGVLHRDIKPQNILVDSRGQVKVTDLGLARATRSDPEARKRSIMGTPHYMAPETAEQRRFDEKTDIYALGATMFHLLTGRVPFDGANSLAILAKHVNEPVPSPRKIDPQIPEPVSRLVELMMAKNPGLRPASAKSLVRAVDEARKKAKNAPAAGVRASRSVKTDTPAIPLDRPAGWNASSSPSMGKPAAARPGPPSAHGPPVPGGPRVVSPGRSVIRAGGGSPVLYMLIGAFAVAIVGVVVWVVVTGKSRGGGSRGGSSTSGGRVPSRTVSSARMSAAEAGRKLKEADTARENGQKRRCEDLCKEVINRCPDYRWVGRAWEILAKLDEADAPEPGRVTSAADPGREREAATRLAEIEGELEVNPRGKFLVARKLVLFIRTYRGTRASEKAKDILRGLYGGKLPADLERIISAGPPPRPAAPDTPAAPDMKRPPGEILKEACDASDEAFRREDYHESHAVLVRAVEELKGTPEATDAAEELDRRDSRIRQDLARVLGRAIALSRRRKYGEAAKLLGDVMRLDPIGKDRERAGELLEANDAQARTAYERVLARARPSMDECAFDRAARELRAGLADLTGTKWHGKIETLALAVEMSRGLIERFAKKVSASGARPPDVTVDLRGRPTTAKLVRAGPGGITLAEGRVQTTVAWRKLSADELCRAFGLFPLTPDDRVGLGAFFMLRGEKQLARAVLEEVRSDPTVQGKVGFLLQELDRSEKVKRLDFSRLEHVDELALTGSWRVADGKLLHDDSKVGTAALIDAGGEVHYRADGLELSFEVVFLEEEGAIEVQLGAGSDACVWFNLGSAGYQAHAAAGGRTAKVEGPWTVRAGHAHAITCRIAGDTLTVTSDRKAMKELTLPGLGLLEGPVTFRAQGARLALDNIVARQKARPAGP